MAFNKFMHPKNPYRTKKPDFKALALKYEEFRKHSTQDTAGKVHLDFKEPECQRALSWALLKDDFDIDIDMPLERLIPTIPLRLNYILWLKDIVGEKTEVRGIDIGCGASCVYPLLASKHGWKMLTSEVDELNLTYAKQNVEKNKMEEMIKVVEVKEGSGLADLLETETGDFDFCMCNPPFFESNLEAYGLTSSRNPDRSEPNSVSTASERESIVEGGEVRYVQQMIHDSLKLRNRIRVYSSMLGKKKSVGVLKNELQAKKIKNYSSYTLCQGRTMRWGLAWSFDESVKFPSCPFSTQKKPSPQQPLVFTVKPQFTVEQTGQLVKKMLEDLKIEHTVVMCTSIVWSVCATARLNTWSHSRRKRRQEARKLEIEAKCVKLDSNESVPSKLEMETEQCDESLGSGIVKKNNLGKSDSENVDSKSYSSGEEGNVENMEISVGAGVSLEEDVLQKSGPHIETTGTTGVSENTGGGKSITGNYGPSDNATSSVAREHGAAPPGGVGEKVDEQPLFKCWISIRKEKVGVILEMKWMRGTSKEAMHQMFQYFKNHFK